MGLGLRDSRLAVDWTLSQYNFWPEFITGEQFKHEHITHTKHGSDEDKNHVAGKTACLRASSSRLVISHLSLSHNTFFIFRGSPKRGYLSWSANSWRNSMWKNTHMHTHMPKHLHIVSLPAAFCRLSKKCPDSSSKPFSFLGQWKRCVLAQFHSLCLLGSARERVCMHACVYACMCVCIYIMVNEIFISSSA